METSISISGVSSEVAGVSVMGGGSHSVDISSDGHLGNLGNMGNMRNDRLGLEQGLVVGGPGLDDGFGSEDGSGFDDGGRDVLGGHELSGGDMGDGRGFMDDGGFGNGVSDGGDLRGGLSISMSFSNGIGKVTTKTVRLNGG